MHASGCMFALPVTLDRYCSTLDLLAICCFCSVSPLKVAVRAKSVCDKCVQAVMNDCVLRVGEMGVGCVSVWKDGSNGSKN